MSRLYLATHGVGSVDLSAGNLSFVVVVALIGLASLAAA